MRTLRTFIWIVFLQMIFSIGAFAAEENGDPKKTTVPSTKTSTAARTLLPFNAINFASAGNLYIKQSQKENFTVEAEESILPLIKVYVKDKILYLNLKDSSKYTKSKINYYLNIKELQSINSYETSMIFIQDDLSTDVLNLSISNFGVAKISINANKLIAKIDGGAKVDSKGIATEQEININGAGEFNGSKLRGKTGTFNITGSGLTKVHISETLNVNITGQGTVMYCGEPNITRKISGKGMVESLDENNCKSL